MLKMRLIVAAVLAVPAPLLAATTNDDCATLDWTFREARTEFPALKNSQFRGAMCRYQKSEFKCEWTFPSDRYGDAQLQVDRLERCTAAQPHTTLIAKGHQQAIYQVDPNTKALIRGPDGSDGDWAIELSILTTADWN